MDTFFIYILKSAVCLSLLYLFYRLLLSKETFHQFNRIALLGILLLSSLIPFVEVTTKQQTEVYQALQFIEQVLTMPEGMEVKKVPSVVPTGSNYRSDRISTFAMENGDAMSTEKVSPETVTISWLQLILFIYLVGVLFYFFRNIYSLLQLLSLLKSGEYKRSEDGTVLVIHERIISPFSWIKYIVISRKDLEENGREILIHEKAHIHNGHSWDLLIADICIIFQWFNPGAWLLKQELQNIHEYEADETVIKEGVNAKEYQLLLIKKAVGTRLYSMVNSFNHGKLKKRISMMLKKKSSRWAYLKYIYVLPLTVVAVTTFACPEISERTKETSVIKVNDLMSFTEIGNVPEVQAILKDTVKKDVQARSLAVSKQQKGTSAVNSSDTAKTHAIFVVGSQELVREGMKKMSFYFEKAGLAVGLENVPEGKTPLILLDGKEVNLSIANALDPQYIKSLSGTDAGEYAIKKYGDKGKCGVLEITLYTSKEYLGKKELSKPIGVKVGPFEPTEKEEFVIGGPHDAEWHATQAKNAALIIVDGKEVPNLRDVPIDQISDFSVLKNKRAIEVYGEKGSNGVIIINTLKSSKKSTK
ncbi:M56 family metallopeptidase [Bacteroides sp.]|uniref:M56 family metallopeptidase n=1 Tax=Bacteroides sp. TaxID=29523 RepID=UPI0026322F1C|nr:M56 family metallopeptidase [Bacteroides sp.]MDD3038972.1 M56 family metallopeptidase [Bacteroides sp.]